MAIIEELNDEIFIKRFEDYDRLKTDKTGGNFTRKGLKVLFKYLDELSEDTAQNIKLDVIALCCDYSEYKNLDEYLKDFYTTDEINEKFAEFKENFDDETAKEQFNEEIEKEINDKTIIIKFSDDLNDGFIIQNY